MRIAARIGGMAAAALLALLPGQAAMAQAPSSELLSRLLGPLAPQGVVGRAGDWEMAVAEDGYVLANRASSYGARFVSMVPPSGPLALTAEVRSDPGNAPPDALVGAGLLFEAQGAGAARRFALVLVERSGEIGLFRGDATGLKRVEGQKLSGATGFVRLALTEEAGQFVITANGIRVAGAPATPTAGTRVGIAAVGPGKFAFRSVRVGTDPATLAANPQRFGRVHAQLPPGWSGQMSDEGALAASGPADARVVWWPFRRGAALGDAAARELLATLARAQAPDLAPADIQVTANSATAALTRDGRTVGRATLHHAAGDTGTTGIFAMASAADWTKDAGANAAGILASVRLDGPAPASRPEAPKSRRWSDPAGGFSVEVPQGWTVTGGTQPGRDGAPAWIVNLLSPDNATRVFLGDPDLPLFLLPTERLKAAGMEEGATFRYGDGTPVLVARHMPGLGFAEVHGMRILTGRCTDEPKAEYRRRRADLAEVLARALLPAPTRAELETGEVAMSCNGRDGPLAAYVVAATDGGAGSAKGAWSAPVVLGFVAPRAAVPTALQALGSLAASIAPSSLSPAGRIDDAAERSQAAARVAAALAGSWWSTHGPRAAEPRTITTLADAPAPVEGDRLQRWFGEGPGPGAGIDWRKAMAPAAP